MADLSLRIKADTEEASRQFKALAENSEYLGEKIAKFTEKFKTESVDKFIDRQNLAAVAMQATGRDMDALNSQVASYQREIERLIKSGLDPQDDALKKLQSEYAGLLIKQDEARQLSEAEAATAKAAADAEKEKATQLAESARKMVALLTASTDYERQTIELNQRQQELRDEMERLIKSGLDPQDELVKDIASEYRELEETLKDNAAMAKKHAENNENLAAMTVKLLDAETDHEKTIVRLTESRERLKKEVQDLVSSGLSPEDEEVKKLQGEYSRLTREVEANEAAHRMQEKAVKAAQGALLGIGAAIAAGAGLAIKAAAANEDMIAAFTPLMNGDVNKATALFKAIQKEAATTPFEIDKIAASVKALMPAFGGSAKEATAAFRMLGDTAGGNAQKLESITSAYTKSMLKGKVSMQEINQIANAGVPIYSELAKSMGVTEAKMMDMSKKGQITSDDLTRAFQNMTSEGGIFFKGMETSSDTFNMRLLGIKENLGILAGTIGEQLLPVAKDIAGRVLDAVQSFTEWIQEGDNLKKMADKLIYALAGVTAGLVAFLVVTKGAAAIHAVTTAFRALTAAMAANPFGAIAVAVTAVLIPALIALYKNWDVIQTYLQHGIARLEFAFKWMGSQIEEKLTIAFNAIKIAGVTLLDFIFGNIIRGVGRLLEVMGQLPFVGEMFAAASETVAALGDAIGELAEETRQNSREAIQAAKERQDAIEAELLAILNATDEAANARRAELQQKKEQIEEELQAETEAGRQRAEIFEDAEKKKIKTALELLRERLNAVALTEQQALNEQANVVVQFLQQRAELENVDGAARIVFLKNLRDQLLADETNFAENRIAIEKAANEAIAEEEQKLLEQRKSAFAGFFSALASMVDASNEKSVGAFYFARALASAEAMVNSYLAFTKALNDPTPLPTGVRIAQAGTLLASGLAAQVNIWKQQPSFETGGRFIVPDVSPRRIDNIGLRVNPGEEVNITPRGMATGGADLVTTINLIVDGSVIAQIVNKRARAGEIYNLQLAGNL